MVLRLILMNVAMYALPFLVGMVYSFLPREWFTDIFGLHLPMAPDFKPWQFGTYMFMHSSVSHLFSNMLGLFVFGPLLEQVLGVRKFLTLYFVTGLGAGALYMLTSYVEYTLMHQAALDALGNLTPDNLARFLDEHFNSIYRQDQVYKFVQDYSHNPADVQYILQARKIIDALVQSQVNVPLVGASGAIMGILMAFGLLFPNTELMLLFPPIPVKAKWIVLAYAAYDVYRVFDSAPDDHVAHYAHLGGMVFGYIMVAYWRKQRNSFY